MPPFRLQSPAPWTQMGINRPCDFGAQLGPDLAGMCNHEPEASHGSPEPFIRLIRRQEWRASFQREQWPGRSIPSPKEPQTPCPSVAEQNPNPAKDGKGRILFPPF